MENHKVNNNSRIGVFTEKDADLLESIIQHRRDVRGNRFIAKPIEKEKIIKIIRAGMYAPSVGFSQPWEMILVRDYGTRQKIRQSFNVSNDHSINMFDEVSQKKYQHLKLEGILESDLNIAVFYKPSEKPVLGQTIMPDMGRYSVVCAVQNMWLMARTLQIGMGWVSILDPENVKQLLKAPQDRELIGYLCLGYTDFFYTEPELALKNWNQQKLKEEVVFEEMYPQ